jgi:hypothetical protein
MVKLEAWMSLLPGICRWNMTKAVVNDAAILLEPPQHECLAQVREKSASEFLSGRIELIKDVRCPSLHSQETVCGLVYQILVQRGNGAAKVQKWV